MQWRRPITKTCIECRREFCTGVRTTLRCRSCNAYGEGRKLREKAHRLVSEAVREGRLPRLAVVEIACVDCGSRATVWEHRDYTKPLDVQPTCRGCDKRRGPGWVPGMNHADEAA